MMKEDTSTVYLCYLCGRGAGYFLYGIDITLNNEQGWVVTDPRLLLTLDYEKREDLVCAKFGSKLYFLAGTIYDDDHLHICKLPSDVMVYDTTDSETSSKEVAYRATNCKSMHSGKFKPVTFEANGKLYVLGASPLPGFIQSRQLYLFEEYDPEYDCWNILSHPPFEDYAEMFSWDGGYVISSSFILILGTFRDFAFWFNPLDRKWQKLLKPDNNLGLHSLFVDDGFYGVLAHGDVVSRVDPPSPDEPRTDGLPCKVLSIDWGDLNPKLRPRINWWEGRARICYLGDGIFCAIESAHNPYVSKACPEHLVNLFIYKKIQGDPSGYDLKCLHLASWSLSILGNLTAYHVMRIEEKDKWIQVVDENIDTGLEKAEKIRGVV